MNKIYAMVARHGVLSDDHREELKNKRGLTDDSIASNKFFSGGGYLAKCESALIETFTADELVESGVMIRAGKTVSLSPQLMDDRIVIPYIDTDENITLLRPHKLGLKNVGVQIYQRKNLSSSVVLTEGEFKAAACQAIGQPCIAIPGIGSFSGKHFEKMVEVFNAHGVKNVCIIFDNEAKDDPNFPKLYKDKPWKRYDVQYFAHMLCKDLDKESFHATIGQLPDGWRIDGKADIDSAIASGKGLDDIKRLISKAKTHQEFFTSLSQDAKKVILQKRARKYFRTDIKKEFGKYLALRVTGTGKNRSESFVEISNFIIKIIATHKTPLEIIREVVFINELNERSKTFSISAEDMASSDKFKIFCLSKGNFLWRGRKDDLDMIWQEELLNDDGRHIHEHDHIGWIASEGMWLFGNVAITRDGKELRADDSHIFWTDQQGIKPMSVDVAQGRGENLLGVPYLSLTDFNAQILLDNLSDAMGFDQARLTLGWCYAVLYLEELFRMCGSFPFLLLTGKRSSGKSRIAEWLMNIYGVESEGIQAADTTAVGLQRYLAYYSSLPVFVDEYRNSDQVTNKNGLIRNAYNRQSAIKGVKADYGVRQANVRGTMIITGQEPPRDNAIMCRCIHVIISEYNRNPSNNPLDWFMANKTKFSNIALQIIRGKTQNAGEFKKYFSQARDHFEAQGIDSRKAINYASVAAGYGVIYGNDQDFGEMLHHEIKRVHKEIDDEEETMIFWDELISLKHAGMIKRKYWTVENGRAYLFFNGLYNIWAENYTKRNREAAFTAKSLRDIIKNETYCVDVSTRKRIENSQLRCVEVDLSRSPESILSLVDYDEKDPKYKF